MVLTGKQKKYLKKHLRRKPLGKIAADLGVSEEEILKFLKSYWRKEKYQKFLAKQQRKISQDYPFDLKKWFIKNRLALIALVLLVFIAYANSINNVFVSDDIDGILKNPHLDEAKYIFANPFSFFYTLIHYLINKGFGRTPAFYRIANIFSHLGTTLTLYLLLRLSNLNNKIAIFAASIFAVHPILTESVTWISGGYYSYSALLVLLSFSIYIFSSGNKKSKYYLLSIFLYFLALSTSEKVIAFPIILFFYEFSLGKTKINWKKIIPFVILSGIWTLYLLGGFSTRVASLKTEFYQKPQITNPLIQIPIAITSYLELIFWPKALTLYHSEMTFSQTEYFLKLGMFILFLGLIAYFFKKNRQILFWLSFFIIALLPTLTPFGVSWIVAERYIYLGAIGIFVVIASFFDKLTQIKKLKPWPIAIFALIIIALSARTIVRNFDWKNQDTLWLATAKTSPSSPQNHNNLGDYYARHGNYEKAIEEFKIAIELQPNYGDAFHNLANVYHQINKDNLAIENYQKALSFNTNLWQSHQNLAAIYFEHQDYQSTEQHLLKAVEISPDNPILYLNLGVVYLELQDTPKAKQVLQQVLQLDPQNEKAKQILMGLP